MLDRILVVDDEPIVLDVLSDVLSREGFQVFQAARGAEALERLRRDPCEVVLADIRMPGMDGLAFLREVQRCHPGTDVILMTGFGSVDGAIDAMTLGAADYLTKPLKPKEIVARIRTILQRRRLESELLTLQSELRARYDRHHVVASSPRMMAVVSALNRIAGGEEPVVLHGEDGTGRRFLSRVLHYMGRRRESPFACLECGSPPPHGFAAALFGDDTRRGPRGAQLERTRGGTLHLAEVERLPADVQERLGECLRERGWAVDGRVRPLETRVVVSTGVSVDELRTRGRIEAGLARQLGQAVTIHVPPLRERREDLSGLVAAFAREHALHNGQTLRVETGVVELLAGHGFPGNVGQLFTVLAHCATLSLDGVLTAELAARGLRQAGLAEAGGPRCIAEHLDDREYQLVLGAVRRNPGRLDDAARELGISRTTLWRRMRKYDIRQSPADRGQANGPPAGRGPSPAQAPPIGARPRQEPQARIPLRAASALPPSASAEGGGAPAPPS